MPAEWTLRIVFPIFKWNGEIGNCNCYGAVRLLVNGLKVMEMVLQKDITL